MIGALLTLYVPEPWVYIRSVHADGKILPRGCPIHPILSSGGGFIAASAGSRLLLAHEHSRTVALGVRLCKNPARQASSRRFREMSWLQVERGFSQRISRA